MGVLSCSKTLSTCIAGLCLAVAVGASAQTILLEPAAPLLPQKFGAWQMQDHAVTGTDPAQIDAPHTTQLKEDGLQRFSTAKYKRGAATLDVKVLQFIDATGATAALSLYRADHTGLHSLSAGQKLGSEAATGNSETLFRSGNSLVIAASPQAQATDLQPLWYTLPKISGPRGVSPTLPTLLPAKGLVPESIRYNLGPASYASTGGTLPPDILGFDKSAEIVTANYATREGKGTLTLFLYPTPQLAAIHGRNVEGWLNSHHAGLGTIKLRREGPLVALITGTFPSEEAQRLVENIHLRTQVTWSKKLPQEEFHAEVRKTASLLANILIFSGLLMLAAVLLAIFLGGGRAAVRVMRGKPAATEPEFLNLGLERGPVKPINESQKPGK